MGGSYTPQTSLDKAPEFPSSGTHDLGPNDLLFRYLGVSQN